MKKLILIASLLTVVGLSACNKKEEVTPVVVTPPAAPAAEPAPTTVVVTPPAAPAADPATDTEKK